MSHLPISETIRHYTNFTSVIASQKVKINHKRYRSKTIYIFK